MDAHRFDALARSFAVSSRRRLLRRLLGVTAGAALGAVGLAESEAATCRGPGDICREHANCCSKICGPKDRTGRRTCVCPAGQENCGGVCKRSPVDYQTDPANCGQCGHRCPRLANGTPTCLDGACSAACNAGFTPVGASCCPSADACQFPDGSPLAGTPCCGTCCLGDFTDGTCCPVGTECCGAGCVDPTTQECCPDGNGGFAPCTGTCCVGDFTDGTCCPPGTECCGAGCVDLETQECCPDGNGGFAPCTGTCCVGDFTDGTCCPPGTECCGAGCVDPATQCCCSDGNGGFAPRSCPCP